MRDSYIEHCMGEKYTAIVKITVKEQANNKQKIRREKRKRDWYLI